MTKVSDSAAPAAAAICSLLYCFLRQSLPCQPPISSFLSAIAAIARYSAHQSHHQSSNREYSFSSISRRTLQRSIISATASFQCWLGFIECA